MEGLLRGQWMDENQLLDFQVSQIFAMGPLLSHLCNPNPVFTDFGGGCIQKGFRLQLPWVNNSPSHHKQLSMQLSVFFFF